VGWPWLQHANGRPWRYTGEQFRFVLWWYAVDESGTFLYRDGVLQRLKGWGKDPLGATLCAVEFVGPSRPPAVRVCPQRVGRAGGAAARRRASRGVGADGGGVEGSDPQHDDAFPGSVPEAGPREFEIDLGKEIIYAHHGQQRIESVTSSPRALEGARSTFVLRNETHHWLSNNDGHEMDAVIERNATKSADGSARALSITNAYEPSEDSVAQRAREAFEADGGWSVADLGHLVRLARGATGCAADGGGCAGGVEAIRGDSVWLNIERIVASDPGHP
jgi:hypothetical protein